MYESLSTFLQNFSAGYPLLWAFLVLIVIGGMGLVLYAFWELVLKGLVTLLSGRTPRG